MKNQSFHSYKAFFTALFLFACTLSSSAQDTTAAVHIGFIYPVSSNGKSAASYTNRFSLHAIAGLSKNETAFALSGVANVIRQNAAGVQIAGAVNVVGNAASGGQIAGAANVVGNSASGAQVAGFANVVKNEAKGAQIAGFMNLTGSAGAAQIAGFTNIARQNVKGLQLAGFLNKAGNVNAQVSGFANIARNVKGVQLAGLINIADSSDYPIALFNFIKNGEKSIALTWDETMTGIASFRSGGKVMYGIAGVGFNFKDTKKDMYAVEAGLGAHIPVVNKFRINLEAISHTLSDFKGGNYFKNSLRIIPAYRIGPKLEIFAGPTFNYVNYAREDDYNFVKKYIWKNDGSKDFRGVYAGFNAGLQLIL
ncbi:hypothetical protein [Dyadobacter bucti]|uniref:hypothetical protein n=1 Tax=Dyadobacter bucti TaxID=2572203 RepID=UPI00110829B5|nr:hypothetical protein [Dyadobacter bucti]